jgi:hypothetical protein
MQHCDPNYRRHPVGLYRNTVQSARKTPARKRSNVLLSPAIRLGHVQRSATALAWDTVFYYNAAMRRPDAAVQIRYREGSGLGLTAMTRTRGLFEDLAHGPGRHWQQFLRGAGQLNPVESGLQFVLEGAGAGSYSNAQIDDYQGLARRSFPWRPPLNLTVRARFSRPAPELAGTAGFGFWNDPFLMTGLRVPALPRAAWFFFASPPSDMKLDKEVPGYGWKAATVDALRPIALALAPLALPAILLMNIRSLYRSIWPPVQRCLNIREALLPVDITRWHTYTLEWGEQKARFLVASKEGDKAVPVLEAPSPRGPLGFVMWMDNQYLVATPWGRLRWGMLDVSGRQWMEVSQLGIEPGKDR